MRVLCFLLLVVALSLFASGCIVPLTADQQSDWRLRQYQRDYRPLEPRDPGLGYR